MAPLQELIKDYTGTIRWVEAHPEKRNSLSANWSRDDCLNHVADRIAGGTMDFDIDCEYEHYGISATEIMNGLKINYAWSMQAKNGTTPNLAGLQHDIDNWRLRTYMTERDEFRADLAISRPPRWTDTTPALAAQIHDVKKSTLTQASFKVKLIWDKHWHMGNQAKAANSEEQYREIAICPLCQAADSQQHWIIECQASTLPVTRRQFIELVNSTIRRERKQKHERTARWMEIALDLAVKHPQGADAWVGMWTPTLREELRTRYQSSYPNAFNQLKEKDMTYHRSALLQITRILADGVCDLWTERADAIKQLETPETQHTQRQQHSNINPAPLQLNQPTMTSFWQTTTQQSPPPATGRHLRLRSNKNKPHQRPKIIYHTSYKTPQIQQRITEYTQQTTVAQATTQETTRQGTNANRGGSRRSSNAKGEKVEGKGNDSKKTLLNFFSRLDNSPTVEIEETDKNIATVPKKPKSPTGIG